MNFNVTVILDKWFPRQAITNYTIPHSGLEVVANHEELRKLAKKPAVLPSYRRATSEGDTIGADAVAVPRKAVQEALWERRPWLWKGHEGKVWLVRGCILEPFTAAQIDAIARRLSVHYPPETSWRREIESEVARIDRYALHWGCELFKGPIGRRRRAVIARHNVKRRWQGLGVWNPAWAGCPGDFSASHRSWTWRWQTENGADEEAVRQKAIAVVKRALLLREGMVRGETVPVIPRPNLPPKATASQAETFIISRPWFMYQLELLDEEMRHSRAPAKERKCIHVDSPASIVTKWWKDRGDWRDKPTEVPTEICWKWRHEIPEPPLEDLSPIKKMIKSPLDAADDMKFSPSEIDELKKIESGFYENINEQEEEDNIRQNVEGDIANNEAGTKIQHDPTHPPKEAVTTKATPNTPLHPKGPSVPHETPAATTLERTDGALSVHQHIAPAPSAEQQQQQQQQQQQRPENHQQQNNVNEPPQAAAGPASPAPRQTTTSVAGAKRQAESPPAGTAPPSKKPKCPLIIVTPPPPTILSDEEQQQQQRPDPDPAPTVTTTTSSRPVPARRPETEDGRRPQNLGVQLGRAAVERARTQARTRAMRFTFASGGDDDADAADVAAAPTVQDGQEQGRPSNAENH